MTKRLAALLRKLADKLDPPAASTVSRNGGGGEE